jgi:hypothetical protein
MRRRKGEDGGLGALIPAAFSTFDEYSEDAE